MGMVAPQQRIASAYFVIFGKYGDVSRHAQERNVSRQWVYREVARFQESLQQAPQEIQRLRQLVADLTARNAKLADRLAMSVVLDEEKQAEFAGEGQVRGVSLQIVWELLDVLIHGRQLSVATLGRRTKAAGEKAGPLLEVLDKFAQEKVRDAAGDEVYVNDPVRMMVEQESLCWLSGLLGEDAGGAGWAKELRRWPHLEQFARDGGTGLQRGVALVNAQREGQGKAAIVDQGDHYHALRGAGVGLRKAENETRKAWAAAEAMQQELDKCHQQGQPAHSEGQRAAILWRKVEQAMDAWTDLEKTWQRTKQAMQLITPAGELNTRAQCEEVLAQTLPQLPEREFAKTKRLLQKPEMLNYLDHVHAQIAALPIDPEVKQAAVRQESLRRRPEVLKGESAPARTARGILLVCAVILSKAGATGDQAVTKIREIFRRAYRASSLVECINSVLRMHQSRHRNITQGLLDLKRLYWNCHTFRTGHRRGTTPYQRLGLAWPEGLRWWDVLKLTPEQLSDKLSTAKKAP